MKNFTIAIVSFALLWGLNGCLYPGDYQASGYYSDGYPYLFRVMASNRTGVRGRVESRSQ